VIYVKRDAGLIPQQLLDKAVAAQKQLDQLPANERAEHIKKNSKIWRDFKDYLSQMSHGKCWYSESPEAQSHLDVDHFRPKLEARRDEKVCDKPGYEWLAFSWDNFRLSAQLSNRPVRNEETDGTDGKGSWFPLVDGSPKACWEDRCVDKERPMLLDPTNAADVRLIEVRADGRMGPSKYCHGTNKARVQASIVRLGLDLPRLKEARLRAMRDVKTWSDILVKMLEVSLDDDSCADKAAIDAAIDAIQAKTHPRESYAAAARSQLRMMGYGDLCVTPEEA
jgi:hypothetical protein